MIDEEELKTEEMMSDIPLLKKISSGMRVEPYSRLALLTSTVNILESLIKLLVENEPIPEHELIRIESTPEQFKASIKQILDDCIIKNLEVDLITEDSISP